MVLPWRAPFAALVGADSATGQSIVCRNTRSSGRVAVRCTLGGWSSRVDRHRNHFDNYFTGPIAGLDWPTVTSTERCYSADVITSSKRNTFIFSDMFNDSPIPISFHHPGRYWFLTHCGFSSLRLYSVGTLLSVDYKVWPCIDSNTPFRKPVQMQQFKALLSLDRVIERPFRAIAFNDLSDPLNFRNKHLEGTLHDSRRLASSFDASGHSPCHIPPHHSTPKYDPRHDPALAEPDVNAVLCITLFLEVSQPNMHKPSGPCHLASF